MTKPPKGSAGERWLVKDRVLDTSALPAESSAYVVVLKNWHDDEQFWSVTVLRTGADARVQLVDLWKPVT